MRIKVVGLGPGSMEYLPARNLQLLKENSYIYLRTSKHPIVKELQELKVNFKTFDEYYERFDTFEETYNAIVQELLVKVEELSSTIIYGVPGNPMVAESTVKILIREAKKKNIPIEIIQALSGLEATYSILQIDPSEGLMILDALNFEPKFLESGLPILFTQVHSRLVATDLKLTLMEYFSDDLLVKVVKAACIPEEELVVEIPLYELDRLDWINHLTTLYVPSGSQTPEATIKKWSIEPLVDVMQKLRGPEGCPWDKKQDHQSLKRYLLEETYEIIDAIDEMDMDKLSEELGDLLLQIVFHSQIAKERGLFDINVVINRITEKLKRRHPHVFAEARCVSCVEVEIDWDKIKREEKDDKSVLADVPRVFPALLRAEKLQRKASRVGFDWPSMDGPMKKIGEELAELKDALARNKINEIKEEIGDLFFALVNVCRFLGLDPEDVLQKTNDKFIKRFSYIENYVLQEKLVWEELNLQIMDDLWEKAKKSL